MKRFIALLIILFSSVAFALDLELTQGVNATLPLGMGGFGNTVEASSFNDVIQQDFKMTGQFKLISGQPYGDQRSMMDLWQRLGADSVLSGEVRSLGGNRYLVHYTLLDVATKGRLLLGKEYQVSQGELRQLAHHVSDEVYQKLTGERGIFSTRIAYVLVKRRGELAQYSLEVADVDGSNPRALVISNSPIMSPAWSPDGRQIAYTSFERRRAQIFIASVETGQRRLVTEFPGINGAPAWSPDGKQLAVVLSKAGSPKIYTVDLRTGSMQQVTFGDAIDTEPKYSPDGRSLLFTSGRGGSPQIYKLDLATKAISRLTYDGNYNAKASYTPNQQAIVMLHREDRAFNIGVMPIGQNTVMQLTDSPMDESPAVAPNGRMVVYATKERDRGVLGLVSIDGRMNMHLPPRDGDIQEPAWSPFV